MPNDWPSHTNPPLPPPTLPAESVGAPVVISPGVVAPPGAALHFSKKRLALALAIAGFSDALSAFLTFAPPMEWAVDLVTALLLFAALGWHWLLLPGFIFEAIPGLGVFPFWVLVVGSLAVWGTPRPKSGKLPPGQGLKNARPRLSDHRRR